MLFRPTAASFFFFLAALYAVERVTAFTNHPRITTSHGLATSFLSSQNRYPRLPTFSSQTAHDETVVEQEDKPFPLVERLFPGAIPYSEMLEYLTTNLEERQYSLSNTLCATSFCGDELNRPLEKALTDIFNDSYSLGGSAGFPFGGLTAFQKMKLHIPDHGNCLIVHASHVGVNRDGKVGTVERSQCNHEERGDQMSCCRSAVLAAEYVLGVLDGTKEEALPTVDMLDISQYYVGSMLMPHAARLKNAGDNAMVELPFVVYEEQTKLLKQIVEEGSRYNVFPGNVAILGGIQINTPPGMVDYFVPINFSFYNGDGSFQENLISENNDPWAWG